MQRDVTSITVVGAGVAGSWQALVFARAGYDVTVLERDSAAMTRGTSHWAGGMLAPWCEQEVAEPVISRLGIRSLALWREQLPSTLFSGSLVVAHSRDRADFERFARLTTGHEHLDAPAIATLEPALEGRFREALWFPGEGHVEPRKVVRELHERLAAAGGVVRFEVEADPRALAGIVIDCRGLGARREEPDLRGVKGEMIVIETDEVTLSRPVRVIHPRWPLYIVPRGDGRFMLGATTIESEDDRVSVRSALELLSAAYAVHPAFAEARVVEVGTGLRPAYPDNRPRITVRDRQISVNGLYRHGFLLAPALAELTLAHVQRGVVDHEVMRCS